MLRPAEAAADDTSRFAGMIVAGPGRRRAGRPCAAPSRPVGRVARELTECAADPERPSGCAPLADASLSVVHRGRHRGHGRSANAFTTGEVAVDADAAEVPVAIDGETVMMATPVRCAIRPPTLRAGCPKTGPGPARPSPPSTGRCCGRRTSRRAFLRRAGPRLYPRI